MIPTFTRSYLAAAAIAGHTLVKFAAPSTDKTVTTSAAATDGHFGVADKLGADSGQMLDVHMGGLVSVKLGGTVAAGAPVTANASGLGVTATVTAGSTVRVVGYAAEPGVSGDIIDIIWAPGLLHAPA